MTPTQLKSIKKELQDILDGVYLHGILNERRQKQETIELESGEVTIQQAKEFIESKLKAVEVTRGLENFKITMEEIEKARDEATGKDWYVQDDELVVKKGSYVIYRINLKSNKLGGKEWT